VVTARRREENVQNVPISISAVNQLKIDRLRLVSPNDLNSNFPAVQVTNSTLTRSSASYVIRGLGQPVSAAEPAVVTYVSEIPTAAGGQGLYFDLQSLQVLKGPQGTLFGRNTTGGAILVEPKRPSNDFEGYVDLSAGTYGMRRVQAAVNVPIFDDKLLLRLAFDVNRVKGYTRDLTNSIDLDDTNYQAVRVGLTVRPSERIENYLSLFFIDNDSHTSSLVIDAVDPAGTAARLFPTITNFLADQQLRGIRSVRFSPSPGYDRYRSIGVTNITTIDVSDSVSLKNIAGYRAFKQNRTGDADGTPLPILDTIATPYWTASTSSPPSQEQFSNELQLQAKLFDDRMDFTIGAYIDHRRPWPDGTADVAIQLGSTNYRYTRKTDTGKAIYAQLTYDASSLVDGLSVTAGGRYTWDTREQISKTVIGSSVDVGPTPAAQKAKFSAPTYNFTLSYQPSTSAMVYATISHGYKTGGFNTITSPLPTFKPEYLTNYEAGAKLGFSPSSDVDGHLNLALYHSDFTDIQASQFVLDSVGAVALVIANGGKARVNGIEAEAELQGPGGFGLSAFYGYTDAKYIRYTVGAFNAAGLQFALVPKHKFGLTPSYEFDLGSSGQLRLQANYTWQSEMVFSVEPQGPENFQGDYGKLNLRLEWNNAFGKPIDFYAFSTNVTQTKYKQANLPAYGFLGFSLSAYGPPRMTGIGLKYRY
jgi:iron complex outermembrane receptor protein